MKRGVDGPDGKEMTSSSHLEMGHPVYTLGTGAGMNKFNKTLQTCIFLISWRNVFLPLMKSIFFENWIPFLSVTKSSSIEKNNSKSISMMNIEW